jgi:hypothetical protein
MPQTFSTCLCRYPVASISLVYLWNSGGSKFHDLSRLAGFGHNRTKQTTFPTTWKESPSRQVTIYQLTTSTIFHVWERVDRETQFLSSMPFFLPHGRGKSEQANILLTSLWPVLLHFWVVSEGLTARHSSCPVCLLCREDWLFLIQAIDVSVLTDLNWLGIDLARPLESFFFLWPTRRVLLEVLAMIGECGIACR